MGFPSGGVDSAPFALLSAWPPGAAVLVSTPVVAGPAGWLSTTFPLVPSALFPLKAGFCGRGAPTPDPAAGGAGFAVPTAGGVTGPPPSACAAKASASNIIAV